MRRRDARETASPMNGSAPSLRGAERREGASSRAVQLDRREEHRRTLPVPAGPVGRGQRRGCRPIVTPGAIRARFGGGFGGGLGVVVVGVVVVVSVDVESVPVVPVEAETSRRGRTRRHCRRRRTRAGGTMSPVRFTGMQDDRAVGCPQTLHFAAGIALESRTWPSRYRSRPSWRNLRFTIRPRRAAPTTTTAPSARHGSNARRERR